MVEWASGASERTFNQSAANRWNEPTGDQENFRCKRTQHENCRMSESYGAAVQRAERSFKKAAARI